MNSDGADIGSSKSIEFLAWLEVNKRRIGTAMVVVAVLGAGLSIYGWYVNQRETAASAALLQLQSAATADPVRKGPTAAELERLATEHAGTSAGTRALLFQGAALFSEERYADAKAAFEKAEPLLKSESLQAVAAYGVAASLDAMGKLAEAEAAYQGVVLKYSQHAVASQARLVLGSLHEQKGDFRQAVQVYGQLTNVLMSAWGSEAMLRREALVTRHPELAATNAVTLPSPAGAPKS